MSRATDIHSRTLELFSQLGVVDAFLAAGRRVKAFNAFPKACTGSRIRLDDLESPYPFTVAVLQNDTERLLVAHLATLGVAVERGVRLVGMAMDASGVDTTLVHDDGSRTEQLRCAWLAGCDGISSTVRSLSGIPFQGITYGLDYLVADADLPWSLAHDEVHLFTGSEGFANVVPLPNGPERARVLCDLSRGDKRAATPALARELLARRTRGLGRAHAITAVSRFRIHCRLAARFRHGRALLLGDAAHTCSPLLGQGMNLGIHDAFNLGWKLALVQRAGSAAGTLIESYERERRPVSRNVLLCTNALHVASTVKRQPARSALDSMSRVLAKTGPAQHAAALLCSELGTRYTPSPLVQDADQRPHRLGSWSRAALRWTGAPTGAPASGERAPDAVLGVRGQRLMQHFDGRVIVLLFVGAAASGATLARASRLAEDVHDICDRRARTCIVTSGLVASGADLVSDELGLAHQRYGGAGSIYVVRPDGHVGFRSLAGNAPALLQYLKGSLA
jgi:2-polyprenyl-6-methoxyphenol hydroxylase-like FAD-dependent oxidoreductase